MGIFHLFLDQTVTGLIGLSIIEKWSVVAALYVQSADKLKEIAGQINGKNAINSVAPIQETKAHWMVWWGIWFICCSLVTVSQPNSFRHIWIYCKYYSSLEAQYLTKARYVVFSNLSPICMPVFEKNILMNLLILISTLSPSPIDGDDFWQEKQLWPVHNVTDAWEDGIKWSEVVCNGA